MVAPSEESERAQQAAASAEPVQEQGGDRVGPSFSSIAGDLRTAALEFGEYARYLVSLQIDQGKLLAKRAAFFVILGILALAALAGLMAAGTALLLVGVAGVIGTAVSNFWLGATIVGVAMVLIPAGGAYATWLLLHRMTFRALRQKYADRRQRHQRTFGRDIQEVSRA